MTSMRLHDDLFRRVEQENYHHHRRLDRDDYNNNDADERCNTPDDDDVVLPSLCFYNSQVDVATAFHDHGIDLCYCHNSYQDAVVSLRKAARLRESLLGKYHPDTALTYFRIASILGHPNNHQDLRHRRNDGAPDDDSNENRATITNLQQALAAARRELRITFELLGEKKTTTKQQHQQRSKQSTRHPQGKKSNTYTQQHCYDDEEDLDNYIHPISSSSSSSSSTMIMASSSFLTVPSSSSSLLSFSSHEHQQGVSSSAPRPEWLQERVEWIQERISLLLKIQDEVLTDDDHHCHHHHHNDVHTEVAFTDEEIQQRASQYVVDLMKTIELERLGDAHLDYNNSQSSNIKNCDDLEFVLRCYNHALALESNAYCGTSNDLDIADIHVKVAKCYMEMQKAFDEEEQRKNRGTFAALTTSSSTTEGRQPKSDIALRRSIDRHRHEDHYESALIELEMAEKKYYKTFVVDDIDDRLQLETAIIQTTITSRQSSLRQHYSSSSLMLSTSKITSHASIAHVLAIKATILLRRKKFDEALGMFSRVYTMMEDSFGGDHPKSEGALSDIRLVTTREQEHLRSRLAKRK